MSGPADRLRRCQLSSPVSVNVEVNLAPISFALDKLQWQSNECMTFMGALLPTIVLLSDSILETLLLLKSNANFDKAQMLELKLAAL